MAERTTLGAKGSAVPGARISACAPAAAAERIIVPRLPGSCRASAMTMKFNAAGGSRERRGKIASKPWEVSVSVMLSIRLGGTSSTSTAR